MLYACSAYNQANYIKAFQSFARENFDVEFGTKRKRGCKCILLCDVVSRIPEDVQWVLHNLGLDGKIITLLITFIYQYCHYNIDAFFPLFDWLISKNKQLFI